MQKSNPNYDKKANFFNNPFVDIYSFGIILWELENNCRPFENEKSNTIFNLLMKDKVRPRIDE